MEQDQKVRDQKLEDKWEIAKEQNLFMVGVLDLVEEDLAEVEVLEDKLLGIQKIKMPRPCKRRRVRGRPNSSYFKPAGIRMIDIEESILTMPEFEAIRLVDLNEVPQEEAGKQMQVSQSTLSRVLKTGRKKIADAIVNGKAIKIEK